jgi:hypothetical protein
MPSTPSYCRCGHQLTEENKQKFTRFLNRLQSKGENANVDANLYLATRIRYVVLPFSDAANISTSKIQSQHTQININFLAYQNNNLIPVNSVHYPYSNIMGDPKILFEPIDSTQLTENAGFIVRMNRPTNPPSGGYTNVQEIEAEYISQGGKIESGFIYVYITTLGASGDQTILGVAKDIISNACAINFGTVGSDNDPGPLVGYGAGKTLIHELGHCFGLFHPFSNSTCDSDDTKFIHDQNPQSPIQINPNLYTDIDLLPTTDNGLDNRGRDFQRYCTGSPTCTADTTNGLKPGDTIAVAPYSCATASELATLTLPYETFMIFMDYGDDHVMVGFPSFNVNTMRTVLVNHPELFDVSQQISPSVTPSFPPEPSSSSGLPGWAIAVIVIGAVLILVVILVLVFKFSPAKKAVAGIKTFNAYTTPFVKKTFI